MDKGCHKHLRVEEEKPHYSLVAWRSSRHLMQDMRFYVYKRDDGDEKETLSQNKKV